MKIFRYKNYDFEKGYLPIGVEKKPKQVYGLEAPDGDYYEVTDEAILVPFLKEQYKKNVENGNDYVLEMTAKINLSIQNGVISVTQGTEYGNSANLVINDLKKGFFHTAYYYHIAIIPDSDLLPLHNDVRDYLKNYVNTYYPEPFHIV